MIQCLSDKNDSFSIDVETGSGRLATKPATVDGVPVGRVLIRLHLSGQVLDTRGRLQIGNASRGIDFTFAPSDGCGGREFIMARSA